MSQPNENSQASIPKEDHDQSDADSVEDNAPVE